MEAVLRLKSRKNMDADFLILFTIYTFIYIDYLI